MTKNLSDKEIIEIKSKEEYDKVQMNLLSKGYKWIDGSSEYYDVFKFYDCDFFDIGIVVYHQTKTFGCDFPGFRE